jgi:hypothetical protein
MKTAMLSILFILALIPCLTRAQEEYVETLTIHSEASINIHGEDEATDEIITPRPSCGVVKHRLQEYYKRTAEAEYFLDWYSPEKMGVKESAALLNLLKRTPFFINERLNENVKITHKWEIPKNLYEEIKGYKIWPKELISGKHNWTDPLNGLLPPGVDFEIESGDKVIAKMSYNLSYESFCLDTPVSILTVALPKLKLNLIGLHRPEAL